MSKTAEPAGGAALKRRAVALADTIAARVKALPVRTVDTIRRLRGDISKELRDSPPAELVAVALALNDRSAAQGERTMRWLAYELVLNHRPAATSLGIGEVEALAEGLTSWDGVDTFGLYVAGPAWRDGQIRDRDIHRWARSEDLWMRRSALVAGVALNLKARGGVAVDGVKRTLAVCELLVDDREDMVVKALSWAVRSVAAVDPAAARAFVAKHGERLASRVRREVRNKLETGLKTPKGRAK